MAFPYLDLGVGILASLRQTDRPQVAAADRIDDGRDVEHEDEQMQRREMPQEAGNPDGHEARRDKRREIFGPTPMQEQADPLCAFEQAVRRGYERRRQRVCCRLVQCGVDEPKYRDPTRADRRTLQQVLDLAGEPGILVPPEEENRRKEQQQAAQQLIDGDEGVEDVAGRTVLGGMTAGVQLLSATPRRQALTGGTRCGRARRPGAG